KRPYPSDNASRTKVQIAKSTVEACDAGFYTNAVGERVDIAAAVEAAKSGTVLYELGDALDSSLPAATTAIEVTGESTIEALIRLAAQPGHLACLNFASARNPGGGFLGGAQAQEESLARSSALYPCQLTHEEHYQRNRRQKSLLYLDLALWSPLVPFFRDDDGAWLGAPVLASVITCAAPNAGALGRGTSVDEIEATLQRRGQFVLAIGRHYGVETLVLGAWGAGVFRNDPLMVARIFK
ncbi:MAG TPA: TIGR02452 family protein, partial [Kofleriaceae bacterium]